MFGLFKKKQTLKSTSSGSAAEARAAKEYHRTADIRMAELQRLKRQIESLVRQPKSQNNYNKIMDLNSQANEIIRAMNRITTATEQIPFRNVRKQISDMINSY